MFISFLFVCLLNTGFSVTTGTPNSFYIILATLTLTTFGSTHLLVYKYPDVSSPKVPDLPILPNRV